MFFKKFILSILLFCVVAVTAFTQSLEGIWIEANSIDIVKPSKQYAVTDTQFKLRDVKLKQQTIYPYYCKNGYIYLDAPIKVTKSNFTFPVNRIKYTFISKYKVELDFGNGDKLILIDDNAVKNGWESIVEIGSSFATIEAIIIAISNGQESQYGYDKTKYEGKTVYKNNDLFDPYQKDAKGRTNIERMKQGNAPVGYDGLVVNLHHHNQKNNGDIIEVSRTMHNEYYKDLHPKVGKKSSEIDREAFDKWRRKYWKNRAKDFQ